MIISDLEHLEVVSEKTRVVGGIFIGAIAGASASTAAPYGSAGAATGTAATAVFVHYKP